MKKNYLLNILIIAALLLTACSTNATEVSIRNSRFYPELLEKPSSFIIESFSEYKKHFTELPDYFIPYDLLKEFGDFHHYVNLSSSNYTYDDSFYVFRDASGEDTLSLYIYAKPSAAIEESTSRLPTISQLDDPNHLWSNKTEPRGYFNLGNIYYRYLGGWLSSISWDCRTHVFILSLDEEFRPGNNAFIDLLLNTDTAEAAINEFNTSVEQALIETGMRYSMSRSEFIEHLRNR